MHDLFKICQISETMSETVRDADLYSYTYCVEIIFGGYGITAPSLMPLSDLGDYFRSLKPFNTQCLHGNGDNRT